MRSARGRRPGEWPDTYRRRGSRLEGYPTPRLPWVDVATGSLGQGLPIAAGIGLAERWRSHDHVHTWVLCGDSEMSEGSIWEAFDMVGRFSLRNVTAIVDINRLGQSSPTVLGWDLDAYAKRIEAIAALGGDRRIRIVERRPADVFSTGKLSTTDSVAAVSLPRYTAGEPVATRTAYVAASAALGVRGGIVAIDAEVANSTNAKNFADAHPERFVQAYIAECQMIATAVGMAVVGYRPFASTFAALAARAFDFIRMAAISDVNIVICGSHAGVEIGADGPSQLALEDIAALRIVHGSTVLYPRGEEFPIGGSKTFSRGGQPEVTIAAAGVTVHTALAATASRPRRGWRRQ